MVKGQPGASALKSNLCEKAGGRQGTYRLKKRELTGKRKTEGKGKGKKKEHEKGRFAVKKGCC